VFDPDVHDQSGEHYACFRRRMMSTCGGPRAVDRCGHGGRLGKHVGPSGMVRCSICFSSDDEFSNGNRVLVGVIARFQFPFIEMALLASIKMCFI